jgi:hypothetical protein
MLIVDKSEGGDREIETGKALVSEVVFIWSQRCVDVTIVFGIKTKPTGCT